MTSVLFDLRPYLEAARKRVDDELQAHLTDLGSTPERLREAMAYAVMGGGKRVRPILTIAAYEAVGGEGDSILPVACALELIHTYSLVHDDLPAMDDDDVRRGRATCHKAYDEATAVLVGDALQALAFSWIATADFTAEVRLQLIKTVASGAGPWGMVGGQMADMQAESGPHTLEHLRFIHAHKTGALLTSAVQAGAMAGGASAAQLTALTGYGEQVGLAFQVTDDILDVTADSATLGKTAGKDLQQNKLTYPALMGLQEAREFATQLEQEAIARLQSFTDQAAPLRALATYIVERCR